MLEFLIRTDDGDWPPVNRERLAQVLAPEGWPCERITGPGDLRLRWQSAEVTFSGEPAGWQVTFTGDVDADDAERFVQQVTTQITAELSRPVSWIEI